MPDPTYHAMGKQILRDGFHFADVYHADVASALVTILNHETFEFPHDRAVVSDAAIALVDEVLG